MSGAPLRRFDQLGLISRSKGPAGRIKSLPGLRLRSGGLGGNPRLPSLLSICGLSPYLPVCPGSVWHLVPQSYTFEIPALGRIQGVPRASWLATLLYSASSRLVRDPTKKRTKTSGTILRVYIATSYRHTWLHTYKCACAHTQGHTHTQIFH